MKYALVDNVKTEASKGARGICQVCGSSVIAKCGEIRESHWAHKNIGHCDTWWEPETEWHRAWKNRFPNDWQEIPFTDKRTGERHIADVCTSHGLVIEFQHSKIEAQECTSREAFYKNMVWVVDGARLKGDYPRFLKARKYLQKISDRLYSIDFPRICFPTDWIESSVPVIFDFLGNEVILDPTDRRQQLYCLFPLGNKRGAQIIEISRQEFIRRATSGEWTNNRPEQQLRPAKVLIKRRIVGRKKRVSDYIYDPRKGRFIKRRRF